MTRPARARCSSVGARYSACHCRSVASKTACSRLEAVSSGPKMRKLSGLQPDHVAQPRARARAVASAAVGARARRRRPRSRGSRAAAGRAAAGRRWRAGWRSSAASPARGERGELGDEPAVAVEEFLGPVGAQPLLQLGAGARGVVAGSDSGTWCARQVPSTCLPSTSCGPVQPFGVRSTIIGQRAGRPSLGALPRGVRPGSGRSRSRTRRASRRSARGRPSGPRRRPALDDVGLVAVAAHQLLQQLVLAGSGPAPSGWRSCSR